MAEADTLPTDPMGLLHAGYEALEALDAEAAAVIGRRVVELDEPAGFELIAQARMRQGRGDDAVAAMEQAVSSASAGWSAWNRLGVVCSETGRLERAEQAFRRALDDSSADTSAVRVNLAMLCTRRGMTEQALGWCERVTDRAWEATVGQVRAGALAAAGRWQEVLEGTEGLAERLEADAGSPMDREPLARLCGLRARALAHTGQGEQAAGFARIALALRATCDEALEAMREACGERTERGRCYHVLVRGRWHEPLEPGGKAPIFLRTFHVVADAPEEAVRFAMDLEREELRGSLEAGKARDEGAAETGYKGVTSCSGYMFQPG